MVPKRGTLSSMRPSPADAGRLLEQALQYIGSRIERALVSTKSSIRRLRSEHDAWDVASGS